MMDDLINFLKVTNTKKVFGVLILFSIFISFIESFGLALIAPFIGIAIKQKIPEHFLSDYFIEFFSITNFNEFILLLSIFISLFYIFRMVSNICFHWFLLRILSNSRHFVMNLLFNHYLNLDYSNFVFNNSSDLSKTILSETVNIHHLLRSALDFISELFVILFLFVVLIYVDYKLTILLVVIFSLFFISITFSLKGKINHISEERKVYTRKLYQSIDEMFGNFIYSKIDGKENFKLDKFSIISRGVVNAQEKFSFLSNLPRYFIETSGFIIIICLILYFIFINNNSYFLEILGIYAIAFYRGLPSLNKLIMAYNTFQYYKNTVKQISDDLLLDNEVDTKHYPVYFNKTISLKNINFKYIGSDNFIFKNLSLTIKKGKSVAIFGKSGSGKSTLVNILLSLLRVESGNLFVDGKLIENSNMKSWRDKFGFIPQDIYFYDASVAENIVLGKEIENEKVISLLKKVKIFDYFQSQNGINTRVGQGGSHLSGGQKQRLAIARALYREPEIIVLDEATNALDSESETIILSEIMKLCKEKTLIIITHNKETANMCDQIINLPLLK